MKQNKGGHPVVPVEKSDNSASGKHLCVRKCVWVLMDISSTWKHLPWTRAWLKSALTLSNEKYAFLTVHVPRDKMGCPNGRTASDLRWWPSQESEQQVSCCWKRFSHYLNAASQQTKTLPQSSETKMTSSALHEKHPSDSVIRVNWIQGYQKVGSYTWQKGGHPEERSFKDCCEAL